MRDPQPDAEEPIGDDIHGGETSQSARPESSRQNSNTEDDVKQLAAHEDVKMNGPEVSSASADCPKDDIPADKSLNGEAQPGAQRNTQKRKAEDDAGEYVSPKKAKQQSPASTGPRELAPSSGTPSEKQAMEGVAVSEGQAEVTNDASNGTEIEDAVSKGAGNASVDQGHSDRKGIASTSLQSAHDDGSRRAIHDGEYSENPDHDDHSPRQTDEGPHRGDDTNLHHQVPGDENDGAKEIERHPPRRVVSPSVVKEEERRRGRRLFGGLMSTLSRSGQTSATSAQQKRRQETEARMAEKAREKRQEDMRRLERRVEDRRRDQLEFEERVMRKRHDGMLDRARFLRTKAQPPVFWLPKKLSRTQRESIEDQLDDAHDQIERELADFAAKKGGNGRRYSDTRSYARDGGQRHRHRQSRDEDDDVDMGKDEGRDADRDTDRSRQPHDDEQRPWSRRSDTWGGRDGHDANRHDDTPVADSPRPDRDAESKAESNLEFRSNVPIADGLEKEGGHQKEDGDDREHADESGDVVLEAEEDTVIY